MYHTLSIYLFNYPVRFSMLATASYEFNGKIDKYVHVHIRRRTNIPITMKLANNIYIQNNIFIQFFSTTHYNTCFIETKQIYHKNYIDIHLDFQGSFVKKLWPM